MQTRSEFRQIILACTIIVLGSMNAQVTVPFNQANTATDFVGWDNTVTNPPELQIRHDENAPIEFWTDQVRRMWLSPTLLNQNFAWYQNNNLDFSGHLSIGAPVHNPPLTYVHINQSPQGMTSVGYRPWMRTGTLMTQETDAMYVGTKVENTNQANAVINWSDDGTRPNPDALRFIFSSTPDNANQARSFDGLEIARMIPSQNGNEGHFGIGDFFSTGVQPNERLDLLNRTIRLRDFAAPSTQYETTTFDRVLVADPSDGRVYWRNANTLGAAGCEWSMAPNPEPNHVSTAFGTTVDPNCPDDLDAVGIGKDLAGTTPLSKLYIETDDFMRGMDVLSNRIGPSTTGVKVYVANGTTENRGIDVYSTNMSGSIANNFGAYIETVGATTKSNGVYAITDGASGPGSESRTGEFISRDPALNTHGVYGEVNRGQRNTHGVRGKTNSNGSHNYGVLGEATGNSTSQTAYYGVKGMHFRVSQTCQLGLLHLEFTGKHLPFRITLMPRVGQAFSEVI